MSRKRLKRGLFFCVAAVVLLVVVAVVWNMRHRSRTFHFEDGAAVTVLAVFKGTNFNYDPLLHRLGRKYLPQKYREKLPPELGPRTIKVESNSVVLFVHEEKFYDARFVPFDESGEQYRGAGGNGSGFENGYRLVEIRTFPRRQKEFQIALEKSYKTNVITVVNPYYGADQHWEAERLPIARTNGPVILTLTNYFIESSSGSDHGWLQTQFDLRSEDPRWATAALLGRKVEDATGNSTHNLLSLNEPVWRIVQEVRRRELESLFEHEKLRVNNVAIPTNDATIALYGSIQTNNTKFVLLGVAGAGSLRMTNGVWPGSERAAKTNREARQFSFMGGSGYRVSTQPSTNGNDTIETWTINQPTFFYEVIGVGNPGDLIVRLIEGGEVMKNTYAHPIEMDYGSTDSIYCMPLDLEGGSIIDIEIAISFPLRFEYYVAAPRRREGLGR